MKILLSGGTGLIGTELIALLNSKKHLLVNLVRHKSHESDTSIYWDYENKIIDSQRLEGIDAVIHLAGENISAKRWTEKQKKKILDSRILSTRLLVDAMRKLSQKPSTFICASAIGYYGDRGSEVVSEISEKGNGFLANVCEQWEQNTKDAKEAGIRVVNLRFGVILSENGGALKKMMLPFRFGLGGKIGSGSQYISWISLKDTISAIEFCLNKNDIAGPVNIVSPNPVTNADFTKILGKYLKRPTLFPLPAFAAKMVLGEMADELLLASTRVKPTVLLENEFHFTNQSLNDFFNL